jgi:hypothetical protein
MQCSLSMDQYIQYHNHQNTPHSHNRECASVTLCAICVSCKPYSTEQHNSFKAFAALGREAPTTPIASVSLSYL